MTFDNFPLDVQVLWYWTVPGNQSKSTLFIGRKGLDLFLIKVCRFQVGSFNYDITKIVFKDEFVAESSAIK